MDSINKLTELFKEFPGVGPRQARRFVYYLISRRHASLTDFTRLILSLKRETKKCQTCFRYFLNASNTQDLCQICADSTRDYKFLMIVARDIDLETIEKSHAFGGFYFVLGGTVPILQTNPEKLINIVELIAILKKRAVDGLKEIIVATSLNPEGENTFDYVTKIITSISTKHGIKISGLGRGLSTGTELEYSDADTIKNALKNRS